MTPSCIATCRCSPSPVRRRRTYAPRIEIAMSMPVPVSPIVAPGLHGGPSSSPVMLMRPPQACAIMSNARLLVRAAGAEALDLAIDDRRVQRPDHLRPEAQTFDGSRREVLDDHVGLLGHGLDELHA